MKTQYTQCNNINANKWPPRMPAQALQIIKWERFLVYWLCLNVTVGRATQFVPLNYMALARANKVFAAIKTQHTFFLWFFVRFFFPGPFSHRRSNLSFGAETKLLALTQIRSFRFFFFFTFCFLSFAPSVGQFLSVYWSVHANLLVISQFGCVK